MLRAIGYELGRLLRRRDVRREIDEELALYFESAVDERMRGGMSRTEAERLAHAEFGNMTVARETASRGGWSGRVALLANEAVQDARFALRQYARMPFLTATIVATLSLGIAVNVGLFGFVRSFFTSPVPGIPRDDALVRIRGMAASRTHPDSQFHRGISYDELKGYRDRREVFAAVAGETGAGVVVRPTPGAELVTVYARFVTDGYFQMLGVRPVVGGILRDVEADPSSPATVVLGHRLWVDRFAGDSSVVGRVTSINGIPVTIVGVAPAGFGGIVSPTGDRGLWLPFGLLSRFANGDLGEQVSYMKSAVFVAGRLRDGVTRMQAAALAHTIAPGYDDGKARTPRTLVLPLLATNVREADTDVLIGSAATGALTLVVLLIICLNVGALLVGRALARRREIGVRLALGATRVRLIRQMLVESGMLAVAGGAIAVGIVWFAARVAPRWYRDIDLTLDWTVGWFALAFAMMTTLLFGLAPALHASRTGIGAALRETATAVSRRTRLQRGFVVAQLALTQPLLVALAVMLGLLLQGAHAHRSNALAERTAILELDRGSRATTNELLERLPGVRGIEAVALMARGSGVGDYRVRGSDRGGTPNDRTIRLESKSVTSRYFAVMGLPIVRGRLVDEQDFSKNGGGVVISSRLAREIWGATADPIGRRLEHVSSRPRSTPLTYEVVGVIDSERAGSGVLAGENLIFTALRPGAHDVVVRTDGPANARFPAIRDLVRRVAPNSPILRLYTLEDRRIAQRREVLLGTGAAIAAGAIMLILAALGLYAIIAFSVAQRTREIGLRTAIGATTVAVVTMFVRNGLRLCLVGMAIGLPVSIVAAKFAMAADSELRMSLWGVAGSVMATLLLVALLASWIPARRAARVDPLLALRAE